MRFVLALLLFCVSLSVGAMSCSGVALSRTQMDTLKTAVMADPTASALANAANDQGVADWLNTAGTFVVWKTRVTSAEMHAAYVWTEMDNLASAKQFQLTLMLSQGFINPSLANYRQGISDIFAGAQLVNTRTALVALAKRNATRAEQLLATGTGTTGTPGSLTCEGSVSPGEASNITRG